MSEDTKPAEEQQHSEAEEDALRALRNQYRSEIERRLSERAAQEQAAEVKEADIAKLEDAIGKAVAEKEPTISREASGPVIGYTVIVLRQQMGPSEIGFQVLVRGNGVSPQEERVMAKLVHDITGKMLGEEHRVVPVGRMPAPLLRGPNLPPRPAGR